MAKHSLCVVVPAYNEEAVIAASLTALCQVVPKEHIYVVSDGSDDATSAITRKYIPNLLELRKNRGKATALELLINKYKLTDKYKYILFTDADSRLSPDFLKEVKQHMRENPACIVGTVASHRHGLISAYRTYEYSLSHRVYKQAQNTLNAIIVAPGCASLYRSDVFKNLDFGNKTLTEDFDLTLQIHLKKLGIIMYVPNARVMTQDPPTFVDYWKQILRWTTGTWQNIFLHKIYRLRSKISFLFYLIYLELLLAFAAPIIAIDQPAFFFHLVFWQYITISAIALICLSLEKAWWALYYIPTFPLFYLANIFIQPIAFVRAIFGINRALSWSKPTRYNV
jgi:biofilm PGA synthesis N-glycosyltransferase PgaC